jgi:all-trans-retinol 13,14-reductase
MKTACIIGGGLGGLFCGAILAKEGFQITVVEKNSTIGGGLQSFQRFGEIFDTGMHIIGGMCPGGNIWRICKYLGILDRVKIKDVDDKCADLLYFSEDQSTYEISKGREGFIKSLSHYFPEESENLNRYVQAIFDLTEELDLFHLRPMKNELPVHSDDFLISADELIAKYISDIKLRSILAYMNPLYGGKGGETPAYIHAVIQVLYIRGASRFVGGSQHFAELLAEIIIKNKGEIITSDAVAHVEVQDREVMSVTTLKKRTITADYYISAIHPCSLLSLLNEGAFPKAYIKRLQEIPNAYSAFSLYIKMKPNVFPYINHSEYYMTRYDEIWNFHKPHDAWPLGFLVMTPPEPNQGPYSNKLLVTAPMLFSEVKRWENTTVGHRGQEYLDWKNKQQERLLICLEELHPGIREKIDKINTASPLTIRDFYAVKEGALSGYSKDCRNMVMSQLPVVTKVKNLLLTGQNNNLHGFCGVPLTAIQTCEAILGINSIINKINLCATDC